MSSTLLAFVATALVVVVVPGPDMAVVLRAAARGGWRAAAACAAGVMTGCAVVATAAVLGLTALLEASETGYLVLRVIGACYLILLGVTALREWRRLRPGGPGAELRDAVLPTSASVEDGVPAASAVRRPTTAALRRHAAQGALTNLLNPKVAMFYLAFFPQFDLGIGPVAGPAVLAAVFWGLALLWYVGLIAAVGRVEAWLARRPVRRTMAGVTGTALTGAGLALAVRG